MLAKIYQPAPNAMQSGRSGAETWVLEFPSQGHGAVDPLTGNVRATDMRAQIDLRFETLDAAVTYAKSNNIAHRVIKPKVVKRVSRSYSENFDYDRRHPWTH